MPRVATICCTLAVIAALAALAAAQQTEDDSRLLAAGDDIQRVIVVNHPRTVTVSGEVAVAGPIRQGSMFTLTDIVVPPVARGETTRYVDAGLVATDGFTSLVVGLAGQMKDQIVRRGTVGAILIPDDELVRRALDESAQLLFSIEVKADTGDGTPPYFASGQERAVVAFPRYRVLLYNTSDRTATINVYAYLGS